LGGTAADDPSVTQTWGSQASLRDRLVEEAANLPIGDPLTLVRVARLCEDPFADAREIALHVQRDAAFAATLLRLANSAHFSRGRPVGEIVNAITRLGLRLVGSLALATPGLRMLEHPPGDLEGASRRLHRHAVRSGLASRLLAPAEDADLALAAGLIHNIGLNVVLRADPDRFRRLLATANSGEQLRDVEVDLLGVTHGELGGLITERWRYPLSLITATIDHDLLEPTGLAAAVRLADLIGREAGVGVEAPEEIPTSLFERLGYTPEDARARLDIVFSAEGRLAAEADGDRKPTGAGGALANALDVA
jgi:HD-like signal output (HDOD) protein